MTRLATQIISPSGRYKWFTVDTSADINLNNRSWIVIVGCAIVNANPIPSNGSGFGISVTDPNTTRPLDGFTISGRGYIADPASAGTIFVNMMPRRMLCPPKSIIQFTNGSVLFQVSLVQCNTLDDALAIL